MTEVEKVEAAIDEGPSDSSAHVCRFLDCVVGADAGDVAALRRSRPGDVSSVLYRIAGAQFDELRVSAEDEEAWQVLASLYARVTTFARDFRGRKKSVCLATAGASTVPVGRALSLANVSDARVERLIQARGLALYTTVRGAVHQLASAGQRFDAHDLHFLLLSTGDGEERVRRRIAREFYREEAKKTR